MENPADIAAARFDQKLNCAQAVFSAFAPSLGLDDETALRLASPFGGGISRRGEICGAVSGALMALGLAHGSSTPEGKEEIYQLGQEFLQRFEAGHRSILCRQLLGADISTPEGHARARDAGVFQSVCPFVVREAAQIVHEMLAEK
jgi:C_GCAxxG_C_C family probable redox protein